MTSKTPGLESYANLKSLFRLLEAKLYPDRFIWLNYVGVIWSQYM